MILAVASAGLPAIVTAIGGVCVSLTTVYFNSKKQTREADQHAANVRTLSDQITLLAGQVGELKAENTALRIEIRILKGRIE